MIIVSMDDMEFYAGESVEAVREWLVEQGIYDAEDLEELAVLSQGQMDSMEFSRSDENGNTVEVVSFSEELRCSIEAKVEFPCLFACDGSLL